MSKLHESRKISILHLSDIHIQSENNAQIFFSQIQNDLVNNFNTRFINYLVCSGDFTHDASIHEYSAANLFLQKIATGFSISSSNVIIVPGNHDVDWTASKASYNKTKSEVFGARINSSTNDEPEIQNEINYKKRFENFNKYLFSKITNVDYPENYDDQFELKIFPEDKMLILGLNSAWRIDHLFPKRAGINMFAFSKALELINNNPHLQNYLRIAVCHHPVSGQESMDSGFLQSLSVSHFEILMHGHTHESNNHNYIYDNKRRTLIIGAGTFGSQTEEQVPGIPLQYNFITLNTNSKKATISSRKKEHVNGAWKGDARNGDQENPKSYFYFSLKNWAINNDKAIDSKADTQYQPNQPNLGEKSALRKNNSFFNKSRIIQITVLQLFQMTDLLINPVSYRARSFLFAITDFNKYKRVLNNQTKYPLSTYGAVKPVIRSNEKFETFWKPATEALESQLSLTFIPFQLDLSEQLRRIQPSNKTLFSRALSKNIREITNTQINGHLRIYPPGCGVISMSVTLTFKNEIQLEMIAEISQNIQDLMFIDTNNEQKSCDAFFLDVINDLSINLFKSTELRNKNRRFLPPETTFIFKDCYEDDLSPFSSQLSLLLALTKGNDEDYSEIKNRVDTSITEPYWTRDKMLGISAQRSAIILISRKMKNRETQEKLTSWFCESREVIMAAIYTQFSFKEKMEEYAIPQLLDSNWGPSNMQNFNKILCLIENSYKVHQAIFWVKKHIEKLQCGPLVNFINALWNFGIIDKDLSISSELLYFEQWSKSLVTKNQEEEIQKKRLIDLLSKLSKFKHPFQNLSGIQECNILKTSSQSLAEEQLLLSLREYWQLTENGNDFPSTTADLLLKIQKYMETIKG